jgi:hypothetical protein
MQRQLWIQQWGELVPTFLNEVQQGEDFHRLGVQEVSEFDFD